MLVRSFRYVLAILLFFCLPAFAVAPVEKHGTSNIAAGAQTITLPGSFSHIVVQLSSGSSAVELTFNSGVTAANTDFPIPSGAGFAYGINGGANATNQINYFGEGTTGTISYMVWN